MPPLYVLNFSSIPPLSCCHFLLCPPLIFQPRPQENRLFPFSGTRRVRPLCPIKGHSFRLGAASTAATASLPDWLIKVLRRWSSDCYQLYIHWSSAKRSHVCRTSYGARYLMLVNTCLFCLGGYLLRTYQWRLSSCFRTISVAISLSSVINST